MEQEFENVKFERFALSGKTELIANGRLNAKYEPPYTKIKIIAEDGEDVLVTAIISSKFGYYEIYENGIAFFDVLEWGMKKHTFSLNFETPEVLDGFLTVLQTNLANGPQGELINAIQQAKTARQEEEAPVELQLEDDEVRVDNNDDELPFNEDRHVAIPRVNSDDDEFPFDEHYHHPVDSKVEQWLHREPTTPPEIETTLHRDPDSLSEVESNLHRVPELPFNQNHENDHDIPSPISDINRGVHYLNFDENVAAEHPEFEEHREVTLDAPLPSPGDNNTVISSPPGSVADQDRRLVILRQNSAEYSERDTCDSSYEIIHSPDDDPRIDV